ncbi:hypothetical protein BUALT_Bualt04G0063800 [Buddleja alternifolia]|uniref:NB-ARC domain-containing protein n=1 Tax=Buddleja alternifolia TaxID=168488 RepID=A0AAV6XLS5_9LAMI|nr:hypothetical protein BUALT_Bualt04G0063800 [Buddleja alternifolia]
MEWKLRSDLIHDQDKIPWNDSHFSAVLGHVLEVSLNSDSYAPITTILWDNEDLFQKFGPGAEIEQVENILAEFEAVANEAGSLVYSFFFAIDDISTTGKAVGDLLEQIEQLKTNIIRFSISNPQSSMIRTNITSEAAVVDSSSMIVSLLHDLKELMNREDDLIAHVKGQIKILHQAYWEWNPRNQYDIGALKVAKNFSAQLSLQARRNSDVEDIVVGFEDNTIDILVKLVGGTQQLKIISIFGMPGLGKTTLAKILYNHPSVNHYFDECSWCIISQAYQIKSVLTDILTRSESELDRAIILNMEEESLAERIYKSLKGRRYLIVMDDIWNSDVWDDLRRYFPNDGNGSRILFTSRNSLEVYSPPLL